MGKSLAEKIAELSPEPRKRVGERTATLVSQELALRDPRKATAKTPIKRARKPRAKLTSR